ncbi:MAG TPA: hypothetical protein VEW42_04410 [Candidatus Eisenbacteria bacterium]|nr:hypothetical protein [Candidatus Eisenbacteria bacterium]
MAKKVQQTVPAREGTRRGAFTMSTVRGQEGKLAPTRDDHVARPAEMSTADWQKQSRGWYGVNAEAGV